MKQPRRHTTLLFITLGIIAVVLLLIDMATGDTYIPIPKVWAVLTGGECDEMTRNILLSIRFIRVVVAGLIGIALAVSGLLFSILYPTLVMLIPRFWPSHAASSASGLVLSVASLADILFNAVFGSLVDAIGYRTSFLIMPACMVGCTALLWGFFAKAKKLERCD